VKPARSRAGAVLTPEARRTMKSELGLVGTQTAPLRLQGRINTMKHLLTGVAVVAALAFSAPVWAQNPGPNPGGSALSGPRTTAAPPPSAPPAAMAPSAMSESSSAMPPKHHAHHAKTAVHHRGKAPQLTGGTANQLNQEELARLQAGNFSNPPVEPSNPLPPSPAPTSGGRMSTGGRATSTAPTH
jgi:hypothetical protein